MYDCLWFVDVVRLPSLHCLHGMWLDNTLSLMIDDEKRGGMIDGWIEGRIG